MKSLMEKIISLSIISILLLSCLSITMFQSNAASKNDKEKVYYLNVDRAPRVSLKTTYQDYILIKLTEQSPIKSVKIEEKISSKQYNTIFLAEGNTNMVNVQKNIEISKNKRIIKISKDFFNVKEPKRIRITTTDGDKYSNKLIANYKITRLENKNNDGNYFSVNSSPRKGFTRQYYKSKEDTLKNFYFTIKDYNKIEHIKIVDIYNSNKVLLDEEYMPIVVMDQNPKSFQKQDLTGLKDKKGMYKIKITLKDFTGMTSTEVFYLKIKSKKTNGTNLAERIYI